MGASEIAKTNIACMLACAHCAPAALLDFPALVAGHALLEQKNARIIGRRYIGQRPGTEVGRHPIDELRINRRLTAGFVPPPVSRICLA